MSPIERQAFASILDIPAAPTALFSIADLISQSAGGPALPGGEGAAEITRDIFDFANEAAGTGDPQNAIEMLGRVGGSALIPGPALAASLPSGAARLAGNVAEVLTPITFGATPGRLAANVAVPFGIVEGISEAVEPEQGDQFHSLIDTIQGQAKPGRFDALMGSTSTPALEAQAEPVLGGPSKFKALLPAPEDDDEFTTTQKLSAGLAVVGGLAAWRTYAKIRAGRQSTVATGLENKVSELQSATTPGEAAKAIHFDAGGHLTSQVERAGAATDEALEFAADISQSTRVGGIQQFNFAANTGKLPGSTIQIPRLRVWQGEYNALAGDLASPISRLSGKGQAAFQAGLDNGKSPRRSLFDLAIVGADALDSRALAKRATPGTRARPSASALPDGDLKAFVRAARNDPELAKMLDDANEMLTGVIKYSQEEGGLLSKVQFHKLIRARPHFLPNEPLEAVDGKITDRMLRRLREMGEGTPEYRTVEMLQSLRQRNLENRGGIQSFLTPSQAIEESMFQAVSLSNKNTVRLGFVDRLSGGTDAALAGSVRKVDKEKPGLTVGIYRNGKLEHWEFADPSIRQGLEFAPFTTANTIRNTTRKLYQANTTGPLQPIFSITSYLWDGIGGAVLRPAGRVNGLMDGLLQKATGGRFGLRGDPTNALTNIIGIGQDITPQAFRAMSTRVQQSLNAHSSVWSVINPKAGQAVADRMMDSYIKSTRGVLDRYGTFHVGLTTDSTISGHRKLVLSSDKFIDKLGEVVGGQFWHTYRSMLDAVHDAGRIRYFSQNYKPGMSERQIKLLVQETRNLVGDFSGRGLGKTSVRLRDPATRFEAIQGAALQTTNLVDATGFAVSTIPYYNVALRAMGRFAGAMRDNPVSVTGGLLVGSVMPQVGGMVAATLLGPEYHEYYWSKPGWWRTTTAYYPIPGNAPEDGIEIAIPPEFGWVGSIAIGGVDQLFGLSNRQINNPLTADTLEALAALTGFAVPPVVGAFVAGTGNRVEFGFDPLRESFTGITPIRPEQLTGGEIGRTQHSALTANAEEAFRSILGTAGGMVMQSMNAARFGKGDPTEDFFQQLGFEAGLRTKTLRPLTGLYKEYSLNTDKIDQIHKVQIVDKILDIVQKSMLSRGVTSTGFPLTLQQDRRVPTEEFQDVGIAVFNSFGQDSALSGLRDRRNALSTQIEAQRGVFPKDQAVQDVENDLIRTRRTIDRQILEQINVHEQTLIRNGILPPEGLEGIDFETVFQ